MISIFQENGFAELQIYSDKQQLIKCPSEEAVPKNKMALNFRYLRGNLYYLFYHLILNPPEVIIKNLKAESRFSSLLTRGTLKFDYCLLCYYDFQSLLHYNLYFFF